MKPWMIFVFGLCFGPNALFAQVVLPPDVELHTFTPAFDTELENQSFEKFLASKVLPAGYKLVPNSHFTLKVHSWKAGWDFICFMPQERTLECLRMDFSGDYTLLESCEREECLRKFLTTQ